MLKQGEFQKHLSLGTLRLAFVGMSNSGKSYRSRTLAEQEGFYWHHVDGEIQRALGFADMSDISAWLGYPDTPAYPERARSYLAEEERATKLDTLDTDGRNLVFDTTGSVIYLSEEARRWLREHCLVVNLDVGADKVGDMLGRFIAEPKPVIWDTFFEPVPSETTAETLARCYPALLADRQERYRTLAHVTIPAADLRDASGAETLARIAALLPL